MADYFAFWNPSDDTSGGLRLDFSGDVGGLPGEEDPTFGSPERKVTRSETFLFDGVTIGSVHNGTRPIVVPIAIVRSTWSLAQARWNAIVLEVERASALKMQLSTASAAVWWDVLLSSTYEQLYATEEQREGWLRGRLLLECQPYPRDASHTPTLILP